MDKEIPSSQEFLGEVDAEMTAKYWILLLGEVNDMVKAGWKRGDAMYYLAIYWAEIGRGNDRNA